MAKLLQNGSIETRDGRVLWGKDLVCIIDFCELAELLLPKPANRALTGGFVGGGGGRGPRGETGPQGPVGPPGPPGPVGADIYAATYVVNPTGENANFTTLEDALAAVPADGAYIYLREGTYTPPAGGYVMPSVPVKVYGSGRGSTIFDLGSAADRVFDLGSSIYSFGDFSIYGDGTAGQVCFRSAVAGASFHTTTIERVAVGTGLFGTNPVEVFYDGNGTQRQLNCVDLDVFNGTNATGFFIKNAAAGFRSDFARCKVRGTPSVEFSGFSSVITFVDCLLIPAFPAADAIFVTPAASHVNVISSTIILINLVAASAITIGGTGFFEASTLSGTMAIIDNSTVIGCFLTTLSVSGAVNRIVGNRFTGIVGTSLTLTSTSSNNVVSDNVFDGATLEIQSDGVLSVVIGNSCRALLSGNLKIAEGVTADRNVYEANTGLTTIGSMVESSMRNNWRAVTTLVDRLLTEADRTVLASATLGPLAITLPPAATVRHQTYTIKKVDATVNAVTVTPDGAETIDGAPTYPLTAQWDAVRIISDGTAWFIEALVP